MFQNHIIYVLKSILRSDINKWTYKYKKRTCFVTRTIPIPLLRFRKGGGQENIHPWIITLQQLDLPSPFERIQFEVSENCLKLE